MTAVVLGPLRALDDDVRRLLAAGGAAAPADEGLRRRGEALRELGRQVPALARLAAAVERVIGATPAEATGPFLDLLVLVGQVRASLAAAGCDGMVEEVAPSGPWASGGDLRAVVALFEAMFRSGSRRNEPLAAASAPILGDLRLLTPLRMLCERADEALAELLAVEVLPRSGSQLLLELWPALASGRRKAPWWLMVVCREYPAVGLKLVLASLGLDDGMLREAALSAIGQAGTAAAALVPALVTGLQGAARADRAGYARALGEIGPAACDAVRALCVTLEDESPSVRIAAAEALGQIRSPTALAALAAAADDAAPLEVKQAANRAIARIQNPRPYAP